MDARVDSATDVPSAKLPFPPELPAYARPPQRSSAAGAEAYFSLQVGEHYRQQLERAQIQSLQSASLLA